MTALRTNGAPIGQGFVYECEPIVFLAALSYLPIDPVTEGRAAAFEGGRIALTLHSNEVDLTPPGGVPLIGGDGNDGCNGLNIFAVRLNYTVTAADVAAGTIQVLANYTNGTAHIGESDLPNAVYRTQGYQVRVGPSVSCSITPPRLAVPSGHVAEFCLTATNGAVPYRFDWTGPSGFVSTNQCISIPSAGSAHAGLYRAVVTDANGCTNVCESVLIVRSSLDIRISEGRITLSWPGSATGFLLEHADNPFGDWSVADDQSNPQSINVGNRAGSTA